MKPLALLALLLTACSSEQVSLSPTTTRYEDPASFQVPTTPAPTTTTRPVRTTRAARQAARTEVRRIPLAAPRGDVWTRLAQCESGGNPRAVSKSGKYRGAFQFSLSTWRSIGMSGDPIDHPYSVQLAAAKRLQARSGWGQWPTCARRLGLTA